MCVVTLGKKKTVHAWSASAARKARPGYVPTIALIAPIIPVVLLVVFNVPIILGFTIGSFYALFVCKKLTSFRGACRVLNKDFYDGVVDTGTDGRIPAYDSDVQQSSGALRAIF